ncbi:MAG: 50S ribosomal protein L4 [Planctomycetota bacterium]|nr:50S ribosomal protein L4 [Planctomycetota bacterium]
MVSLPVYDATGSEVDKYEIDPAEIAPNVNKQLLHDVVVMYQASARQGSHKSKSRSEVAGANKKMYRQKGTGNARAGSRRSGIRRGGGHIFAKRPRDYSYRLNKKAVRAATRMAIAGKLQDDQVVVIQDLSFDEPKTSQMANILKALNLTGQTTLVALDGYDPIAYKSIRNIADVSVCPVSDLNALNVLKPRKLLVTTAALDAIKNGSFNGSGAGQTTADQEASDSNNPERNEA